MVLVKLILEEIRFIGTSLLTFIKFFSRKLGGSILISFDMENVNARCLTG